MTLAAEHLEVPFCTPGNLSGIGVVIPTYNAAANWNALRNGLDRQGLSPEQILIVDSASTDQTCTLAEQAGYRLLRIQQSEFSHGGTRQRAVSCLPWAEILIYLTQDAFPGDPDSFRNLFSAFADPQIGAAYGRQIPRRGADAIERHARLFNYPSLSGVRTYADRARIGIKAAFLSNSFAAYRRSALEQVGGFPTDVIVAEDSVVAARLLIADWKVAYVAEATVVHSHSLSLREEFSRYFDTGVHHARERWILDSFGKAGKEGTRFLLSELTYLRRHAAHLIPFAILRTGSKLLAYHLGLRETHLPTPLKTHLSAQPRFWESGHSEQPRLDESRLNETAEAHIRPTR